MSLWSVLLFSWIVSLDGFFAGTAYGVNKINVPKKSLFIIGAISLFCTGAAMLLAGTALRYFPIHSLGAVLLLCIGIGGLIFKQRSRRAPDNPLPREVTFSIGEIVVSIIRKPERADMDHSNDVSAFEAIFLGLALGLDNTAATFAAALNASLPVYTPFVIFAMQIVFIRAGIRLGSLISPRKQAKLSYLPSFYFIALGLLNLL